MVTAIDPHKDVLKIMIKKVCGYSVLGNLQCIHVCGQMLIIEYWRKWRSSKEEMRTMFGM